MITLSAVGGVIGLNALRAWGGVVEGKLLGMAGATAVRTEGTCRGLVWGS
jgi:hypothetical protein